MAPKTESNNLPEEKPKPKVSSTKIDDQGSSEDKKDSKKETPQTPPEEKPKPKVSSTKRGDQESTGNKKSSEEEKSPGLMEIGKKALSNLYHPKEGKEKFVLDENLYRQTADTIRTELKSCKIK